MKTRIYAAPAVKGISDTRFPTDKHDAGPALVLTLGQRVGFAGLVPRINGTSLRRKPGDGICGCELRRERVFLWLIGDMD